MNRGMLLKLLLVVGLCAAPLGATGRLIVRVVGGLPLLQLDCVLVGCTVAENIDGSLGQLFLVNVPDILNLNAVLARLSGLLGILDVEVDLLAQAADAYSIPVALSDNAPVSYFGSTVQHGFVSQPAVGIIRVPDMRTAFPNATGAGVVAIIDTGVDTTHPALQGALLPGYDFTRNQSGADEKLDVSLPQPPSTAGAQPQWVRGDGSGHVTQSTAAVVDGGTANSVTGNPLYSDFGHGTMVAGVVHLVAPTAKILPLKAFRANGTAYTSDILRAIYMAIASHANVLNMSFNLAAYSFEVATALDLASVDGMISVAAAGNNGQNTATYPAALWNVMGVASSSNQDQLSSFSNYGMQDVWVAAPGEGIVTTYPFSTYAAAWGTSFSTPFVSGTAAVMLSVNDLCDQFASAQSAAHAKSMTTDAGNGRLDTYQAIDAWHRVTGGQ